MKRALYIYSCLFLSLVSLHAVEPAVFDFMLRGYCYAGNASNDPNALGGYGGSDNLPQALSNDEVPLSDTCYLQLLPDAEVVFADKYEGIRVRLVNGGEKTVEILASDSRVSIIQEAKNAEGEWQAIEYLPGSWCGNSYHSVYLKPKHYWSFVAPRYSGSIQTELRFKLQLSPEQILYSETYVGGVQPEQFELKQGHQPTNLMDPYTE